MTSPNLSSAPTIIVFEPPPMETTLVFPTPTLNHLGWFTIESYIAEVTSRDEVPTPSSLYLNPLPISWDEAILLISYLETLEMID